MLHREHSSLGQGDSDGIAGHFMRTDFARLSDAALLPEVADAMDGDHVDDLPVTGRDGTVAGIVRREDLRGRPGDETASQVAQHGFQYARYDEPIAEVVAQMRAEHLSALPVVATDGHVQGLVVLDDVADEAPEVVRAQRMAWRARLHEWLSPFGITGDDVFPAGLAATSAGLVVLALLGTVYGGPSWLGWVDGAAAVLAGIAAATCRTSDVLGLALSAFLAAVMAVLWIFGRATGVPGWLNWLHLLLAFGFAGLTVAAARFAPRLGLPSRESQNA